MTCIGCHWCLSLNTTYYRLAEQELIVDIVEHARAGSYLTPVGYQRECSCGEDFVGTAESSFADREEHIAAETWHNVADLMKEAGK